MSTPSGFSTTRSTANLAKLTVPQLKALCKERRIVGYSKLGKAALLKLTSTGVTTPNDDATHNLQPVLPIQVAISETRAPEVPEPTGHPVCHLQAPSPSSSTQTANKVPSAEQSAQLKPLPVSGPVNLTSQLSTVDRQLSRPQASETNHGTKRSRISAVPKSAKKQKSFPLDAVSSHHADSSDSTKPSVPSIGTLAAHAVLTSVTESSRSAIDRPPHSSVSSTVPIVTKHTQLVQKGSSSKRYARFKPLVLTRTPAVANTPLNSQRATFNDHPVDGIACISGTFSLEAVPLPTPSFVNITLPPKLSDRKRVQRWAIILCTISDEDCQTCALVSRAFRYAVYLSAAHILAQKYRGRRLDEIVKRYPQNMTNMWPYLRQRQNEVSLWRRAFQISFIGRYISALGIEPLSARLWASPDDEKQVVVALRYVGFDWGKSTVKHKFRFVLTRLWFTLSVGTNERDPSAWLKHTVEDAQEVVKSEIWAITIRNGISLSVFYVLESTCEVIGRARNVPQLEVYSPGLRSDWSEYISSRTGASMEPCSLMLEHLRWANYEEYDRGVSRHWLRRISGEGNVGLSKKVVAERYVMACVVANSISGQWMSSHGMAQEFAGLPSKVTVDTTRERTPNVNLYLPAHHHVESVHFTTPKGVPFHPALAVVQTPAREYIVLKDNGMQVGCEEDGVTNVWMRVLGCDQNGIAVVCSK
ncbi:hypothetical protein AZE42_10264 [Rhizopogon vesiculosus]|uniref:Rho termination factor N-terminal domain-containing protein n=1 Tax=Rhizopogon vesiculosus TaxID=180088 RepID=A0A1J8PP78_9AGAM|nr:hypothetical protein AZE42_10264 [Rhizopogon vesiculosus]